MNVTAGLLVCIRCTNSTDMLRHNTVIQSFIFNIFLIDTLRTRKPTCSKHSTKHFLRCELASVIMKEENPSISMPFPGLALHSSVFQFLLASPEVFPGQMRYVIPPESSGSYPRVSSQLDVPRKEVSKRKSYRRHPDQMSEPWKSSDSTMSYPLKRWAPHSSSKAGLSHPTRKLISAAWISSFILSVTIQSSWS